MKLATGEVGEGRRRSGAERIGIRAPRQRQGGMCACMTGFVGGGKGTTRTDDVCKPRKVSVMPCLVRGNMGHEFVTCRPRS
jgi:hypothetical protein